MKKSDIDYYSAYVRGIFNMASSCSKWIGLSYADATCFDLSNYKEEFIKCYGVRDSFDLVECNSDIDNFFINIFGNDNRLIDGLVHWIGIHLGDIRAIYEVDDNKLFDNIRRDSFPFYMLENIYFIECEELVIVLMIGNDE